MPAAPGPCLRLSAVCSVRMNNGPSSLLVVVPTLPSPATWQLIGFCDAPWGVGECQPVAST